MFSSLLEKGKNLAREATLGVSNMLNSDFLDALIACGVAISRCDGNFDKDEMRKIQDFISAEGNLSKFKKEKVAELIAKYESIDADVCEVFAIKAASKIKNKDDAKYLIRSLVVLANADGVMDSKEKKFISNICAELSIDPSPYV